MCATQHPTAATIVVLGRTGGLAGSSGLDLSVAGTWSAKEDTDDVSSKI